MNAYVLGNPDGSGRLVEVAAEYEGHTVMVHGADNWGKAQRLLEKGYSIPTIATFFCKFCGDYLETEKPCNCMGDQAERREKFLKQFTVTDLLTEVDRRGYKTGEQGMALINIMNLQEACKKIAIIHAEMIEKRKTAAVIKNLALQLTYWGKQLVTESDIAFNNADIQLKLRKES